MAHDVFISYSSKNKPAADAICAGLEARGIRCWIAPRDVGAGNYGEAIVIGIQSCRVVVLVFSADSNISQAVLREAERAMNYGKMIIPFRLADVPMSRDLEFFLASCHWLDALSEPLVDHISTLGDAVTAVLKNNPDGQSPWNPGGGRSSADSLTKRDVRTPARKRWLGVAACGVLAAGLAWGIMLWKQTGTETKPVVPETAAVVPPSLSVAVLGTQDTSIQDYFTGVGQARVTYDLEKVGEELRIRPACEYLRKLAANEPVEPVLAEASGGAYFQSPPVYLDLKLLNSSELTVYFVEAVLEVESSRETGLPLVVLDAASAKAGQLRLVNAGSDPGPAVSLGYNVDAPGAVPFFGEYTTKLEIAELKTRQDFEVVHPASLVQDQMLCYGELGIRAAGSEQKMRFQTLMPTRPSASTTASSGKKSKSRTPAPMKAAADPLKDNAYPAELRAAGTKYEVPVNLSQYLKPGEPDRFCIAVKAQAWSSHRFRLKLYYDDRRQSVVTPVIDLVYFKAK